MPISFKNNLLFVHIPKTAGTSIRYAMSEIDEDVDKWHVHNRLSSYKNILSEEAYNKMFKFTFVRNPWDRTIALYLWMRSKVFFNANPTFCTKIRKQSFVQFIKNMDNTLDWISINRRVKLDFIGRFEHFNESMDDLCSKSGVMLEKFKLNTNSHEHYSYYYNEETKAMIERKFQKEIEMFDYRFERGNKMYFL